MYKRGYAVRSDWGLLENLVVYWMQVIHGDLAARNVLVFECFTAKITDFGLSKNLCESSHYSRRHQRVSTSSKTVISIHIQCASKTFVVTRSACLGAGWPLNPWNIWPFRSNLTFGHLGYLPGRFSPSAKYRLLHMPGRRSLWST